MAPIQPKGDQISPSTIAPRAKAAIIARGCGSELTYLQIVGRVLRPDGVLVINCFGEFEAGADYFTASLDKTLKSVFGAVRIHASGNGNVFFVATPAKELTQHRTLDFDAMHSTVRQQARDAHEGIKAVNPASGIVLTDDFNPVDFHDAQNRERQRRELAQSMQEL